MGRAGRWYAIEDEGVVPDMVATAKSLAAGFPLSAVTGREELMNAPHIGGLGGTYGGNPVAAAAALAVIEKIQREDLLSSARKVGAIIMQRFGELQERLGIIGEVRGRGAMCAIELVEDRSSKTPLDAAKMGAIARRCLENGVVILTAGTYGNVVRLLPPINIDEDLLRDGLDVLDEAITSVT
jgi:4-aminobutyrate aminotransferase/(S)-3-amino-2-methylpropionate transaminase